MDEDLVRKLVERAKELGKPVLPKHQPAAGAGLGGAFGARMETPEEVATKARQLATIAPQCPKAYWEAYKELETQSTSSRSAWFGRKLILDAYFIVIKDRPSRLEARD